MKRSQPFFTEVLCTACLHGDDGVVGAKVCKVLDVGLDVVEASLLGLGADEADLLRRIGKGHEAQSGVPLGVGQGQAAPAAP